MKHVETYENFSGFKPRKVTDREAEALKLGILPFNSNEEYLMSNDISYKAVMMQADYDEDVNVWRLDFYSPKDSQQARSLFLKVYYLFTGSLRRVEIKLRDWPHGLAFKNDAERERFSVRVSRECLRDLEGDTRVSLTNVDKRTLATTLAGEINSALLTTLHRD